MKVRTLTLAAVALAAVVALAALGGFRWASAVGPDVNGDGYVATNDIFQTISAFGQTVPKPVGGGNEAILAQEVQHLGYTQDAQATDLGAFNPTECEDAIIMVKAQSLPGNSTSSAPYEIEVRGDADGIPDPSPSVGAPLFGGDSNAPYETQLSTYVYVPPPFDVPVSGQGWPIIFTTPLAENWPTPFAMLQVVSEANLRLHVELHCGPEWP